MTYNELDAFFQTLTDDTLDETSLLILFNTAKNNIERRYKLAICESVDSSQTRSSGDTYLSMKSLPTGWRGTTKLYVGNVPYHPIPFNSRIVYRNANRRFYIDHKNSQFAICGSGGASESINHYFLVKTTDFTTGNKEDEIVTWPTEFHPLIAYEAAGIYQGNIDPDAISRSLSASQKVAYEALLSGLIDWDHDLKLSAQDNRHGFDEEFNEFDNIGNL